MNRTDSKNSREITRDCQTIESELVALENRSRDMVGELESQAEEIAEREDRDAPIKRLLKGHDRLRERFWTVENRCRELRAQFPERPSTIDDF